MVDPARIALWAFDARPWPAFPRALDVWADGANWEAGHWLNGRLGSAPVGDLLWRVLGEYGIDAVEAGTVEGVLDGFSIDRPMSARDALEGLARAFGVEAVERGERLVLLGRAGPPVASLATEDLVDEEERHPLSVTRGETQDLPAELSIAFAETDADFRATAVTSRRIAGGAARVSGLQLSAAADPGEMALRGEALLHRLWAARDRAAFALPPSALRLEPGDAVTIAGAGGPAAFRLTGLEGGPMRRAEAESLAPPVRARRPRPDRHAWEGPAGIGRPAVAILALPPLTEAEPVPLAFCAAAADPWRGPYRVWRGGEGLGDEAVGTLERPSLMGRTLTALAAGRPWRWDRGAALTVELVTGALSGQPEAAVLGGANAMALSHPDGGWEVLQFRDAVLVAERTYILSRLIRGQRGTEHLTGPVPPGATIVLLDGPLVPLGTGLDLVGRPFRYRIGSAVLLAADPAMAEVEATADLTALTPFAPVHARARREADGIRIAWTRRTRLGGDGWDVAEVALGEAGERYRLTIRAADGTPVRDVETEAPAHLYAAAEETADFGAPQTVLRLSIVQVSAVAGPGHALDAVLAL